MLKAHQRHKQRTLWRHKRHIGHMTHFNIIVANDIIYPTLVQTSSHCMRYLSIILPIKARMIVSKNVTAHDHNIVSKISCRLCRSDCLTFEHFLVWIQNKYATGRSIILHQLDRLVMAKRDTMAMHWCCDRKKHVKQKTLQIAIANLHIEANTQCTHQDANARIITCNSDALQQLCFLSRLPNFLNFGEVNMQSRSFNYRLQFLMNPQSSCKSRLTKQKVRNSRRKQV